jgi:hypothetical protein
MPGIVGIFSGFWAFSGNFGRFLGTCKHLLAVFNAFYIRILGETVGIAGHKWA